MNFWTYKNCQKRPRAPKPIFLGPESEKSEFWIPTFEKVGKYIKDAPKKNVQNGCDAFPNELTRFPNEAKPIWVEIQKYCKNAVAINMGVQLL